MDMNIVREVKGSMPDVVYPHKQHTEWLDCSNCHPAIFVPQKGANQISMAAILLGEKCGVCHGKVAFPGLRMPPLPFEEEGYAPCPGYGRRQVITGEPRMKKTLIAALLATFVTLTAAQSQPPESAASRLAAAKPDRDQLQSTLESVDKLLGSSSAARQIEASKAADAIARREKAVELHRNARAALGSGDLEHAAALLTEARAVFFEAVRLAAPDEVLAKKLENDYKTRLDSVKALQGAYKRVATEKATPPVGCRKRSRRSTSRWPRRRSSPARDATAKVAANSTGPTWWPRRASAVCAAATRWSAR